MRIAVANNFYPPRVGGSAHLSESLAHGYAAAGHEVVVLTATYGDAPVEETVNGCRVVRIPAWKVPKLPGAMNFDIGYTLRPTLMRRVRAVLDDFKPDVIHQHGQFFDLTWATGLYARSRKIPTLLSVHTRLESPKALYQAIFRTGDATLVAPIMRRYKPRFVVMDKHMDAYIHARYKGAISGLEYIPVGVEPDPLLGGDGQRVRDKHGLGDRPIILSIGHVIPLRDRLPLIRALPRILEKVPDAAVVVVGGVYYDAFQKLAAELGVAHAVHSVGPVPKSEIPDYIAAAALETHDLDGKGLGTASLEAMGAGCPVVAAPPSDNFPGIQLKDREHLYLVGVDDYDGIAEAILEVLADPARAREVVGAGGQRLVHERFTMSSVLKQHLDAFDHMVAARTT